MKKVVKVLMAASDDKIRIERSQGLVSHDLYRTYFVNRARWLNEIAETRYQSQQRARRQVAQAVRENISLEALKAKKDEANLRKQSIDNVSEFMRGGLLMRFICC